MWDDFYDDDSSGWWEDDPPTNYIPAYEGGDALGLTPGDGAKLGDWTLNNMNEEDEIYTTDDATQSGGFWNDLGNALTGTLSGLAGTAITSANQSGQLWVKKQFPTTQTAAPAGTAIDSKTLIFGGLALALVAYLVIKNRP